MRFTPYHHLRSDSPLKNGKLESSNLELSQGFYRFAVSHMGNYIGDLTDRTNLALKALGIFGEIKQELIARLSSHTQMTSQYAIMCLDGTGWDLEKAFDAFTANKVRLSSTPGWLWKY